jgi:hypothetical protein
MDWVLHQQQVRFDIRAERAEYAFRAIVERLRTRRFGKMWTTPERCHSHARTIPQAVM